MTVRIKGNSGCEVEKKYNIFVGSTPAAGFQSLGNTEVCAPDSLRFVISGYSINAPGTTYTVTVNDSTVPISFLHPPMDTVTHWFANSSCGIVSSNGSLTFQNSFRATLDAENPCDITSVSVIPIFVSGKPNPLIGISPSNNVCINSVVTIRNTGDYGGKITSTGGGTSKCENVGKQVWKITPATGYTITSGLLGSLNNATLNGELWTNGTTSLNVTFTVPGIYKVKQYLSNDRCGVDSIEETICVRNPPTASFTMDKKNGCSPAVVNINNTSPVGPCAGEKYNWNVVFSDYENCGSSNGASYTNNTNSTSKNPQISFSKPGRYIIELTVSTAASGCPSPVARDTFYVTAKPTATIPAIAAICAGNTIAPKATVSNCYATQAAAYSWQFTNGVPATSTGADPGSILYNAQGSYAIKLDVTNECGTTTANTTVNITSKPVASAGADKIICSGKTTQLGSTGSGYTYSWKPSTYLNSNTIADPTVTPVYNGPSSDTLLQYVLTVSAGSNCVSTDTVLLTVRRSPVVIVSPTAISICTGGSAQLTASGADTYSWNPASGLNPVNQATVTASPAVSTQYIVTGSLANGCSNTASVNVNVVSFTPANAGADKNYCSGLSTIIGTTGAGMNYSWSPTTGLSDPGNAVTTVNFVNNGNSDTTLRYVLTASAGANCTGTDTVLVTVKRSPKTVVAPLSTDICPGGTAQLVASGGSSYKWTPATGLNFSNKDTVIANPAATQQYTVTGSFSNGCSVDATAIVNVKAKPNVDAGSDTITCKNFPGIQLTGSPGGGSWSGNNFISNAGIFNPLLAGIGTYKAVYAFTANGCNNADSLLITVTNPPVANAGANASYCAGPGTVQLNGTPTGGKWTGSQAVSPSGILQLSTAGSYKLVYNIGNGSCIGTDTVVITIGDAVTNNIISAVQPVCTGNAPATITGAIATAGTYTVSYQWQQSIDSINWSNISGATAKDYSPPILTSTVFYRRLASSSICSQGTPSNEVKAVIHPNAIADFTPLQTSGCTPFQLTPALINLTASPGSNGEYRWLVNNNYIGSGDPFPGYTLSKSADTIQLTLIAVSRFGCFNDTTVKTFTTPRTPVPSFTISDSVGCGPLGITITNTTPDANLFSFGWDFGTGQKSDSVQPGIINFPINPSYGDTVYIVSLKAFTDCDTIEVIKSIRVRAKPKALFTPSKVIGCSPMSVTFTNTSRGSNASFTWDFGDGSPQVPAISTSIQHTFYTGVLDTFYVKLFGKNDCGIDTQQYAIVVNPNAIKLNVAVNGNQVNGCAPHSVLFVNNTKGANLFRWNFGDGSPELTTTKGVDSVLHTYTQTGVYNVSLFATNSCSDTSTTLTITVETGPVVSFSATPTVLCIGQPLSITNTSEAGLAWAWRFGDGSISSVQNPVKSYTTPGNYRIVLTGAKSFAQGFGCADSAVADIIITDTLPGQFTVDSSGSCAPMNVLFKNTSRPSVNTAWNFGDGGTAAGDSVNHVYNLSGIYTAVMVAQAPGGCRYRNEKTIVVNGPSGELLYKGGFVCPPAAVHFEANSNNTSQYRFYPGNGDSAINSTGVLDYTYAKPGRYLPYAVLVTGNCSRIITGTDTVKIEKIQAGFASNSIQQCGSTTVQFTDTSTVYFGITGWDWNFGDGTSSSQKNPSKIFTVSGTYNVRLRITGTSGCSSEVTIPLVVKVNNTPTSQISTGTLRCTDNPTLFTANVNSVDAIETYNWNFGNGSTGSGSSVSYNYSGTGVYTVTLISRTVFGCADTVKQEITINQSPKVSASQDVRICLGQSAPINASGAPQLSWSPQQGLSCTSCASPVATPTLSTLYKVTGVNAIGCPNTDSVLVEVVQPFKISVTPNDTICIGGSSQLFASGAAYYRWNPAIGLNAANIPNPVAKPASTTQYTVIGYDNYSCFTDTAQVIVAVGQYPVVDIGRGSLVVAGTAVQLSPNITNGPISKYNWEPPTWLSCSDCATPVATINNNISYRLTVTNIYGCSGSDTISYQVLCSKDDQVYIPNAFSPDGDGINDVFMVHGKGVLVDYFRVFNRWGQLVFDGGSNYQPNIPQYGWDGKINGKPATQDVYVYMVQVRCTAGGTFTYKGNVSLLYMR
jgi:gliding motility-associated-like protein